METESLCMKKECEIFFQLLIFWRCIAVKPSKPFFKNKSVKWFYNTAWLIVTWVHSITPREATHSTMMSTTSPTLPVLGSNMNLHSDKPATKSIHMFHRSWFDFSGIYSCRSDVKDKSTNSNGQTTWENASHRKMRSVCLCESFKLYVTDKRDVSLNDYVNKSPTLCKRGPTFNTDSTTVLEARGGVGVKALR